MQEVWLFAFGAGVFAVVSSLASVLIRYAIRPKNWMDRLAKIASVRSVKLSDSLQKWVLRAEKEMGGLKLAKRGPLFFALAMALAAGGFVYGVWFLRNPAAGFVLAVAGVVFPEQVFFYKENSLREKLIEQMGALVRVFAAEYAETPHPVKALGAAARKLPDPIGGIMREAEKDLLLGKDRDDVLIELAKKLDFEYGRLFVQLFRLSFEDEAVKPLFARLAARISNQQELIRKNRVEVTADRIMSLALNLSVIPVYLLMQRVIPESYQFFTGTAAGRGVVVCCLVSAVAGAVLDRMVNRGDAGG